MARSPLRPLHIVLVFYLHVRQMEHYEKLRYDGSQKNVVDRVMNEAHR